MRPNALLLTALLLLLLLLLGAAAPLAHASDEDITVPAEDFDEELEPPPPPPPQPPTAPKKKRGKRRGLDGPLYGEAFACGVLVLFAINFLRGRGANQATAAAWDTLFMPLLEQEFSLIGVDEMKRKGTKDSPSEWKCYASGRRYCQSALFTLQLRKRQDMLHLLYYLVSPVYDTLTIDIEMEDTMPGFVFALLPKKSEKEMRRLNADLRHYASRVKDLSAAVASAGRKGTQPNLDKVGAKACVLTDCPELVAYFLPPDVQAALVKGSQYFQLLHFTDQNCCHGVGRFGDGSAVASDGSAIVLPPSKTTRTLRFVMRVPPAEKMSELEPLMKFAIGCIDASAKVSLSAPAKKKTAKERQIVADLAFKQDLAARQQDIQGRKFDKLRQEQEKITEMNPEQQRKAEEKLRKRQLKKAGPQSIVHQR